MDYKLYNIDGVDLPFNKNWNSIAVSVSGGADSALLAYLLCSLVDPNNNLIVNIISHTRMWKTKPWQSHDSLAVYRYLVDKFPYIKFSRHTNFISPELEYGNKGPTIVDEYGKLVSGDNIEIRAFAEYVSHTNNAMAYYNAVTRNPKHVDFVGIPSRDCDLNETNQHLLFMRHMSKWAFHPFRFVEKDWVVKQYINHNIKDLFDITRSCEGEFKGLDYTNYIPGQLVPTCDKCFWCKERMWAIANAM